jgi:preprotein translocase subunit YajC
MILVPTFAVLAQGTPPPGAAPPGWVQIVPLALMFVIMYVLLIRPQQKQRKEHEALLKTLKPKDKVVTSGGVVGIVVSVNGETVTVRSADTKIEVRKSAVTEITERSGDTAQN